MSLHILDIVENSIAADSQNVELTIIGDTKADLLSIEIKDDGKGIPEEMLEAVTDPFTTSRTTRKVGLGLSLFKMAAEAANGRLDVQSKRGKGTVVKAEFQLSHIDRKPFGDIKDTLITLVIGNPGIHFRLFWKMDKDVFIFDTRILDSLLSGGTADISAKLKLIKQQLEVFNP